MTEDEERPASAGKVIPSSAQDRDSGSPGEKTDGDPTAKAPMNGADFQLYIGRQLRAVYDDVARQPVPDRFLELMKKLG